MMGLGILSAFALYLVISILVVRIAARAAKKRGRSPLRWGAAAALVMYLLVFWDHVPTIITHKYYCEKEAGFWIYKTVDQWRDENPGVMETLVANGDGRSAKNAYVLNPRFNRTVRKSGPLWLNRWRWEQEVVDKKTGEVLARYVDFSTGSGFIGGAPRLPKFWLQNDHCDAGKYNQGLIYSFADHVRGRTK